MNRLYEENVDVIKDYIFCAREKITEWEKIVVDEKKVFENKGILYFSYDKTAYKLVSQFPQNEIELYVRSIDFYKDNLVVLFGIANVELLEYLSEKLTEGSRVLVVEPNIQVFKFIMQNRALNKIFKKGNIGLCVGSELDLKLKLELEGYASMGWDNLVYNITVLMMPNYQMYKKFIYDVVGYLREKMSFKITILGNCLEDAFNGFSNTYKNTDTLLECNSISEIKGKYKGVPGIVVASGPSLEKNIKYLKKANGKALIIACDASVDACKANGVELDAVASIERDEPTYTYYYKGKQFDEDLVLFAPTLLWSKIFDEYQGKKVLMCKVDAGPEGWFTSHFENIEYQNIGMSSANVAFKAAQLAGCNPIILVGQDLAYTDGKKHSDSTHTKYEGNNDAHGADGNLVEDIHGNMVKTNFIYNLFRTWIESRIAESKDLKVIDATEGGAKIRGSIIAPLDKTIDKYCIKEKEQKVFECLAKRTVSVYEKKKKYQQIIQDGREEIEKIQKLQKKVVEHYRLLEKLYDNKIEKQSEKELIKTVKEMEKGNQIIIDVEKEDSICTLFRPIIKQTITHVKALGNQLNSDTVIKNLKLQGNLMGMMMRSCDLIIEEYKKMVEFLENKVQVIE